MGRLIGVILIGAAITAAPRAVATERFEFTQTEMAVPFRIVLYMSDAAAAREAAKAAFDALKGISGPAQKGMASMAAPAPNGTSGPVADLRCQVRRWRTSFVRPVGERAWTRVG